MNKLRVYEEWLNILLYKTKPEDLANTTLRDGLKHFIYAQVIFVVWIAVFENIPNRIPYATGFELLITLGMYWVITIVQLSIMWVVARLLGGRGKYQNHVGVILKLGAAFIIPGLPAILIFKAVPSPVIFGGAAILLLSVLYSLFWMYKLMQALHKISALRVVLLFLLSIVINILIQAAIIVALFSIMAGT